VLEDTNKTVEEIVLETLAGTLDLTEIEDPKIRELDSWLTKHKKDNTNKVLTDNIKTIVSQGIIAPEKRFEMLELIQPNLPMTPITPIRGKSGSPSKKGDYRTPASDKQISYLKKIHRILGKKYPETEKPLTKKEASDLIDKLKAKVKGVQRTTTNVSKNKLDLGIE
jgi:hypothetical protein